MDIEKPLREEMRAILCKDFQIFEEIQILSTINDKKIRADLVIIPNIELFHDHTFAIEVKLEKDNWQAKHWSYAAKQAYDYIGGTIDSSDKKLKYRKINAAFVFPAPDYHCPKGTESDYIVQGIFQLAAQFRIGRATRAKDSLCGNFTLSIGANDVWTNKSGWTGQAVNLLKNKIRHGSGKIDR